jgi:hypothetical protein
LSNGVESGAASPLAQIAIPSAEGSERLQNVRTNPYSTVRSVDGVRRMDDTADLQPAGDPLTSPSTEHNQVTSASRIVMTTTRAHME